MTRVERAIRGRNLQAVVVGEAVAATITPATLALPQAMLQQRSWAFWVRQSLLQKIRETMTLLLDLLLGRVREGSRMYVILMMAARQLRICIHRTWMVTAALKAIRKAFFGA